VSHSLSSLFQCSRTTSNRLSCLLALQYKLCKVRSAQFGEKGVPHITTFDGQTVRYPDPLIKVNDTEDQH
jgi:hypothetical protein